MVVGSLKVLGSIETPVLIQITLEKNQIKKAHRTEICVAQRSRISTNGFILFLNYPSANPGPPSSPPEEGGEKWLSVPSKYLGVLKLQS